MTNVLTNDHSHLLIRPVRIDEALFAPDLLNEISSTKQLQILFKIVEVAYLGRLIIDFRKWARELNTDRRLVKKTIDNFIRLGVLERISKQEYRFNFYKSMTKDRSGYVKYFSFYNEEHFLSLPLPSQRIILLCIKEFLTKTSTFSKGRNVVIDFSDWYGLDADNRVLTFNHRHEVLKAIDDLKQFMSVDTRHLEDNRFVLTGIINEERVEKFNKQAEWMRYFLKKFGIVCVDDFHLKHFIMYFEHLETDFGYSTALELIEKSLRKVVSPTSREDYVLRDRLFSLFYAKPDEDEQNSRAVFYFRENFFGPVLEEYVEKSNKQLQYYEERDVEHIIIDSKNLSKKTKKEVIAAFKEKIAFYSSKVMSVKEYYMNYIDSLMDAVREKKNELINRYSYREKEIANIELQDFINKRQLVIPQFILKSIKDKQLFASERNMIQKEISTIFTEINSYFEEKESNHKVIPPANWLND